MNKHNGNGFTLVELLIVIVVIAILSAISVVAYSGITDRAKATKIASDASQLQSKIAVARETVTLQYCGGSTSPCNTKAAFLAYIDASPLDTGVQFFPYGSATPVTDRVNVRFDDSALQLWWWDSVRQLWNYRYFDRTTLQEINRGTNPTVLPQNFS